MKTLIIDEFDTLVDSGQQDFITKLLDQLLREEMKQVVFASATVTPEMRRLANDYFG